MFFLEKPEPDGTERGRSTRRRWVIPPPPALPAREAEGMRILDEVPPPLALLLFQRFRDVHLWAGCPPRHRRALFQAPPPRWCADAAAGCGIREELRVFEKLVLAPAEAEPGAAARACARVAEWAGGQGHGATEFLFAVLAATVSPADPDLAFAAGRAARRRGRHDHAVEWFQRAIGLARRADDAAAYTATYLGWGVLEEQRGRREAARARFVRAWRCARREGLRKLAAAARHNLITVCVAEGRFEEGHTHAVAAYKLYGPRDPRIPRLAHDVAVFWTFHGYFTTALPLHLAALPFVTRPAERLWVLANLCRAAGAAGDRARFSWACEQVLARPDDDAELLARAFVEIGHGAWSLGNAGEAFRLAAEAVELARRRGDATTQAAAEALQGAVRERRAVDVDRAPPPSVLRFARRFLRRLRQHPGAGPGGAAEGAPSVP